jgi:hypothetical protein
MPGKPLVPVALVPVLLSLATATGVTASQVESPVAKGLLLIASTVLAGVAGKTSPQVR